MVMQQHLSYLCWWSLSRDMRPCACWYIPPVRSSSPGSSQSWTWTFKQSCLEKKYYLWNKLLGVLVCTIFCTFGTEPSGFIKAGDILRVSCRKRMDYLICILQRKVGNILYVTCPWLWLSYLYPLSTAGCSLSVSFWKKEWTNFNLYSSEKGWQYLTSILRLMAENILPVSFSKSRTIWHV